MSETKNYLTGWAEILEREATRRRLQDDEDLARVKSELPGRIAALKDLSNEDLMETCIQMMGRGFADPRMTAVTLEYGEAAKRLVIQRMNNGS